MRPLLFTTIPPGHDGVPLDPRDGGDRRIGVIRSWHEAGFAPVSINLEREVERHPGFRAALQACGVESIARTPSGGAAPDRACPVAEILAAIGERAGSSPFLVMNADIRLAAGAHAVAAEVARLGASEFLLARRTDEGFDGEGHRQESVFANGFDGVAIGGGVVARVLPFLAPGLAFGRPWWDHYLPLALIATGSRPRLLDAGWFRHESHPFRWKKSQYGSIGRAAFARFRDAAGFPIARRSPGGSRRPDRESCPGTSRRRSGRCSGASRCTRRRRIRSRPACSSGWPRRTCGRSWRQPAATGRAERTGRPHDPSQSVA